ncbi:MAG: hypothetical protein IJ925_06825 [Muribaculaceae bacterium]|nr:hypothetical protein [Muribaculaceae bacterium]
MKIKVLLIVALITTTLAGCGNKDKSPKMLAQNKATATVIDNKDEETFLRSFLDSYIKLDDKQAQELARQYLTQDFYSDYIEHCNNQDNAVDVICETAPGDKVEMVETITKGDEDPNSYIVQVQLVGPENKPFPMQYDMTVVKEDGKFKLSDSEVND